MKNVARFFSSESRTVWTIFLSFLLVRVGFILLSGYNSFELQPDTARYNYQSDQILAGHFNLLTLRFITAPLYPYLEALIKLLFGPHWIPVLQVIQVLLSCLSGVYLYKTAGLLWGKHDIAMIVAAIYCFFPLTFWWVHTFSQETLFQCLLIFTMYYLLKAIQRNDLRSLCVSAVLFSLTFLTKSHILLFAPFIPIMFLLARKTQLKRRMIQVAVFVAICAAFTLPYGLYNLHANGVYVISSTGLGGQFLTGHTDDTYRIVVDPPPKGSAEYLRLKQMQFSVWDEAVQASETLTPAQMDRWYLDHGLRWCVENPGKAFTLAAYDLYYVLMPGVNPHWYPFNQWLAALLVSLPVYALGYTGIVMALKQDFERHFWSLALAISVVAFAVLFYVQNRFRTITIEPFYIMYAASVMSLGLRRFSGRYRAFVLELEGAQANL